MAKMLEELEDFTKSEPYLGSKISMARFILACIIHENLLVNSVLRESTITLMAIKCLNQPTKMKFYPTFFRDSSSGLKLLNFQLYGFGGIV